MFIIKYFSDYHDIDDGMEGWKRKELGCFLPKEGCYCQYFAAFWKGKRPTRKAVIKRLKKKVSKEQDSFYVGSPVVTEQGSFYVGNQVVVVEFDESEVDYN